MPDEKKVFQYVQLSSIVSPDFWYKLAEIKLDVEKLNEESRPIRGVRKLKLKNRQCFFMFYPSDFQQFHFEKLPDWLRLHSFQPVGRPIEPFVAFSAHPSKYFQRLQSSTKYLPVSRILTQQKHNWKLQRLR